MATPNEQNRPNKPEQPQKQQPGKASGQPPQGGKPVQRPAQSGQQAGQQRPAQPGQQQKRPAQPGQPQQRPAQQPGQPQQQRPAQPGQQQKRPAQPNQANAIRSAGKPAQPTSKSQAGKPANGSPDKSVNIKKKPAGKKPNFKPNPKKVFKGSDTSTGTRRFGQVLVDLGFIDDDQLWEILDEAKSTGELTGQVAVARGLINDDQLLQALAEQHGLRVLNMEEAKPTQEALELVPETMSSVYKVMPLTYVDDVLTVVVSDPNQLAALDDLRNFLNVKEVKAVMASQEALNKAMDSNYADKEESIVDLINAIEEDKSLGAASLSRATEHSIDIDSLDEITNSAPVRKLLNMVMLMAIKDHASDIHFEPFEEEYKMRYRCDGVLYEMIPPPRHLANAIATRIKVMSNLDIAERRLPQDGRIELNVGGNQVDMRVSVLPTMFGESVVIRVLDRTVVNLDLNKLGMDKAFQEPWNQLIHSPNGIVLVTGPTGSGKTTTLYSSLNELNEITEKIITTEDPIEYDIDGIIQVPINPDIGVTFANSLRAILRQDPDIILVGEIRDLETAQIAVQAALTGHVVFSTLHTNDAPSTITRLRDMGVEPFLITATVRGILAQRLVRRICVDCRTEYDPSDEILMELNLTRDQVQGKKFYYGKGCDRCNNTGHRKRSGLFELITFNDELRDMISANASADELREACRKHGMQTLRESGLKAIFEGVTTIEEVVHETVLEDEA